MNQIKLQTLTPDVYYNQSRDFQFIGRLFDIVLNSVKTNSELLYNIPMSQNSDQQLIDLMAMTLGFKSKHNYNVKQLTALCSAFATVLKNKGNITSIIIAIKALLNAEGISDTVGYSLEDNNTTLNLFIPQALTDINLLKDLLIYILPAGMNCNIIREFQLESVAATKLGIDNILKYTWEDSSYKVNTDTTSVVPQISSSTGSEYSISSAKAGAVPGLIGNSDIKQIEEPTPNEEN